MKKTTLMLLLLLMFAAGAHTWSEAEAIVETDAIEFTGGPGKYSQLVGPDGTLHMVFFSDHDEPDNREIYYMKKEGGSWSEPLRLSHGSENSHGPTMAIDGEGNITVVWYDYRLGDPYSDLFSCRYTAAVGSWSEDTPLIVTEGSGALIPVAVAEPGGKVHLVWSDGRNGNRLNFELYYTYWQDGQWADEVQLTDAGQYFSWMPAVKLDDYGILHLFWADDRSTRMDWHIYYKRMSPEGVWGPEINLGPGVPHDIALSGEYLFLSQDRVEVEEPSLGIYDPDEEGYSQIRYSVKHLDDPDNVWLIWDRIISSECEQNVKQPAIAASRGGARIVWAQGVEGHYNLYQSTVGPLGFSVPVIIGPLIGNHRRISLSTGSNGDLNLVYSYTPDDSENWDIYYRHDAMPREENFEEGNPQLRITSVFPNPTSHDAVLHLDIQSTGDSEVAVYDTAGRRVGTVFRGTLTAGRHELVVETSGLHSGAYYIQATTGGQSVSTPLIVTR